MGKSIKSMMIDIYFVLIS